MATPKDCHTLTNYYIKAYENKYGHRPVVNRNTARWGFDNILYDLNMVETRNLIDFYMLTGGSHNNNLQWFFNNYEKLVVSKKERDEDRLAREALKEETKRRTEEWRKRRERGRETD